MKHLSFLAVLTTALLATALSGFSQDTYKPKYLRQQDDASKALLKLTRYTTDMVG